MNFHASYLTVVVTLTEIFLWVGKKCQLKEKCFIHKLKKQIVPLGAPLIDEEQVSGEVRYS